ncbi:MAG: hypothetical protein HYZ53_22495 [Planctomycetes bacterium]|nr:hypothetical protein [Planctomycetota bacterium]
MRSTISGGVGTNPFIRCGSALRGGAGQEASPGIRDRILRAVREVRKQEVAGL